ncbi:MAG: YihY/virulence factor BrkB family protein [Oscillospiraceae bacterium]|jgi:membrane protein|nr:YihY/virulence factor BrkB family protein [Oscillospiraceae bacterium]
MKLLLTVRAGIKLYTDNNADGTAVQLAYNLMLSSFPLLICVSALLSGLNINASAVPEQLRGIIPDPIMPLLGEHSAYAAGRGGAAMFTGAVILMLTSGSAAFRAAIEIIRDIHGLPDKFGLKPIVWSFIYAAAFLAIVFAALIVLLVGGVLPVPRYIILFVILLTLVWGLYRIAVPSGRHVLGALFATVGLTITGSIFTAAIASSTRYSLVYGSVSAVVLLMIWLGLCSNIVIVGAVISKLISIGKQTNNT